MGACGFGKGDRQSSHSKLERKSASPDRRRLGAEEKISFRSMNERKSNVVLIERANMGGMGTIIKGFHLRSKRMLAMINLTKKDIAMLEQVRHPQILSLEEDVYHIDCPAMSAVEYLDQGSIFDIIQAHGCLPESVISFVTQQVLSGLAHIHSNRVVHRDLTPSNILVSRRGQVKIAGFSLACELSECTGLTEKKGSGAYMSPEMVAGFMCSEASDIWSLGLTVIYCATGKQLNENDDAGKTVERIWSHPKSFSLEFCLFIDRCMAKDPISRSTAIELLSSKFITIYSDGFYKISSFLGTEYDSKMNRANAEKEVVALAGRIKELSFRETLLFSQFDTHETLAAHFHVSIDFVSTILSDLSLTPQNPSTSSSFPDHTSTNPQPPNPNPRPSPLVVSQPQNVLVTQKLPSTFPLVNNATTTLTRAVDSKHAAPNTEIISDQPLPLPDQAVSNLEICDDEELELSMALERIQEMEKHTINEDPERIDHESLAMSLDNQDAKLDIQTNTNAPNGGKEPFVTALERQENVQLEMIYTELKEDAQIHLDEKMIMEQTREKNDAMVLEMMYAMEKKKRKSETEGQGVQGGVYTFQDPPEWEGGENRPQIETKAEHPFSESKLFPSSGYKDMKLFPSSEPKDMKPSGSGLYKNGRKARKHPNQSKFPVKRLRISSKESLSDSYSSNPLHAQSCSKSAYISEFEKILSDLTIKTRVSIRDFIKREKDPNYRNRSSVASPVECVPELRDNLPRLEVMCWYAEQPTMMRVCNAIARDVQTAYNCLEMLQIPILRACFGNKEFERVIGDDYNTLILRSDVSGIARAIRWGIPLNRLYCSPLNMACHYGKRYIVRLLVEHGHAKVNTIDYSNGYTALMCAASDPELVKYLLDRNANPSHGQPLKSALMVNCDKSVKLLLSAGADPTLPPEAPALETALSHYRSTYVIKQMLRSVQEVWLLINCIFERPNTPCTRIRRIILECCYGRRVCLIVESVQCGLMGT